MFFHGSINWFHRMRFTYVDWWAICKLFLFFECDRSSLSSFLIFILQITNGGIWIWRSEIGVLFCAKEPDKLEAKVGNRGGDLQTVNLISRHFLLQPNYHTSQTSIPTQRNSVCQCSRFEASGGLLDLLKELPWNSNVSPQCWWPIESIPFMLVQSPTNTTGPFSMLHPVWHWV